jgi:MerR family transcriptional regulator, copper efflux regulator
MPAEMAPDRLTIGKLAQLGGVNLETVRYYEREGLLPKPPRTTAGYRIFPRDAARRLRFIKRAQELGFSLSEIRELLSLRVKSGARHAEVRMRARSKIVDIDQKIRTLQRMKNALRTLTERCEACAPSAACPIVESLEDNEQLE